MRVSGDPGAVALHRRARPGRSAAGPRRIAASPVRAHRPAAAERGPDAGDQLGHLERLAHVVVGARLEAHDDVDRVRAGREHDDRRRGLAADRAADLEAVEPRQHDVEQDEVRVVGAPALEPLVAVGRGRRR